MKHTINQAVSHVIKHTNTVIIGGGQAGLAMSRCLHERNVDHIVLERGKLAERWRSERWDSLHLLSPNWMARLPHYQYTGNDPDGFMTMPEYIRYLETYASSFHAPVQTGTSVESVQQLDDGRYRVQSNRGTWIARNVVVATGFCDVPRIPAFAPSLSPDIHQLVPSDYRNSDQLPAGNVLVVGASATGVQIADELLDAGRDVTISVGNHVRLPRRYRGKDILHWMVAMGAFAASAEPSEERQSPPPQLVGTIDNRDLDLGTLGARGANVVGRTVGAEGHCVRFADDSQASVTRADAGLRRVLSAIDDYIQANCGDDTPPAEAFRSITMSPAAVEIDCLKEGISSVVWATGYQRNYAWLQVPVIDDQGDIQHRRGVTSQPGLYVLGMRFQATKGSNLIDGVGPDAEELAEHITTDSSRAAA